MVSVALICRDKSKGEGARFPFNRQFNNNGKQVTCISNDYNRDDENNSSKLGNNVVNRGGNNHRR